MFYLTLQENPDYSQSDIKGFLYEFRDLAVYRPESRYLSSIITSFKRLDQLGVQLETEGSHWYNHYLFKLIKPFSQPETIDLFFSEKSPLYIPVSPRLRPAILEITDGHPALLQNAGFLLNSAVRDGEIIDIDRFIEDFYAQTKQIFQGKWNKARKIIDLITVEDIEAEALAEVLTIWAENKNPALAEQE